MASYLSSVPPLAEFFPPTPQAYYVVRNVFRGFQAITLLSWTPLAGTQAMGRSSVISRFNLPGRYAWAFAEIIGPLNMLFILYSLPAKLAPAMQSSTSMLGTGLPVQHEVLGWLYVLHYLNRAVVTPLFLAPSMSPIHPTIAVMMGVYQFLNAGNIGCWIVYGAQGMGGENKSPVVSVLSVLGLGLWVAGLTGNILAENKLFEFRRGAAKRKAKSEGKAVVSYDKVYVIPPKEGLFRYVLYPHYVLEWMEWAGYWVLGEAWGLGWGWDSAALWFVMSEVAAMLPRAWDGRKWYEGRFGKRAVAGRAGAIPVLGL